MLSRAKKIRCPINAMELAFRKEEEECADTLRLFAACRGVNNGLMAEVMDAHNRKDLPRAYLYEGHTSLLRNVG